MEKDSINPCYFLIIRLAKKVRPAGFEPATYGFEVRNSIQLSYRRINKILEDKGVEPRTLFLSISKA
jgi:hypothetical protein